MRRNRGVRVVRGVVLEILWVACQSPGERTHSMDFIGWDKTPHHTAQMRVLQLVSGSGGYISLYTWLEHSVGFYMDGQAIYTLPQKS